LILNRNMNKKPEQNIDSEEVAKMQAVGKFDKEKLLVWWNE